MIDVKHRYLTLFSMLYITMLLATVPIAYKVISIGPFAVSASSIAFPFIYVCADIIAEIYGFRIARQVIWCGLACDVIFAAVQVIGIHTPHAPGWNYQLAYQDVLGHSLQGVFGGVVGILVGEFLNVYLLAKWKQLTNGRYFWLRSLGSSSIGQSLTTFIGTGIAYYGDLQWDVYVKVLGSMVIIRIISSFILVWPTSLIVFVLKIVEGDYVEPSVDINPFKFEVDDED